MATGSRSGGASGHSAAKTPSLAVVRELDDVEVDTRMQACLSIAAAFDEGAASVEDYVRCRVEW